MSALQAIKHCGPVTRLELDILAQSMATCDLKQLAIMYWLSVNLMRDHHNITDAEIPSLYAMIQNEIIGVALDQSLLAAPPNHHPLFTGKRGN